MSLFLSAPSGRTIFFPIFFNPETKNLEHTPKKKKSSQTSVALIVFFNYYYTFLQLDPADLAEQLKKQGASIPAVRPGRATAEHITGTLTRMSILGSAFLGALAAAPPLAERLTGLTAFRGFAGTSLLILVGVATDTARKVKAEQVREKDFSLFLSFFLLFGDLLFGFFFLSLTKTLSLFFFSFTQFSGDEQVPGHRQAVRRPEALRAGGGERNGRERKIFFSLQVVLRCGCFSFPFSNRRELWFLCRCRL